MQGGALISKCCTPLLTIAYGHQVAFRKNLTHFFKSKTGFQKEVDEMRLKYIQLRGRNMLFYFLMRGRLSISAEVIGLILIPT